MATYDYVDTASGINSKIYGDGIPVTSYGKSFCVKRHISLPQAIIDLGVTTAFAAADVLHLFNVHEGMFIQNVCVEVTTAEGATLSCTVGDTTLANGWITAFDMVATGWFSGADATYHADYVDGTVSWGKLYTADDEIDITLTTATAETAVFDIYIFGYDLRPVA